MPVAYQWNAVIPLMLLATPLLAVVALIAARHWHDRVARPLWWLSLAVLIWVVGYAFELGALDRETIWWWLRLEYAGIVAIGPLWLLVALRYLNLDQRLGRLLPVLLVVPPVLTYIAVFTNDQHHLFYTALDVGRFEKGPLFWVHTALAYSYLLVALTVTIARALDSRSPHRRPLSLLVAATIIPFAGNAIYLLVRPLGTFDPTPSLLTLSAIIIAYSLTRGRLLQARPVALRTVLAAAPDAILVANSAGHIIEANAAASQFFGIAPPMTFCDALALAGATAAEREMLIQAAPQTTLLRSKQRIIEIRTAPVVERDHPAGLIAILRDVTERERLVEQLAAARTELEERVAARTTELLAARTEADARAAELIAALAAIPDGIVVTDAAGHPRLVNDAAQRLLHGPLDPDQTLGQHLLALAPHDTAGLPLTPDTDILTPGPADQAPAITEIMLAPDSSQVHHLAVVVAPIHGVDGATTGSVAVFRDLTDVRRLERARREFLAMVAHELRSPVTTISMGAQLLQRVMEQMADDDPLVLRQREPVAAILRQAQRLTILISDLLEGARLESSVLSLTPVPFDLADLAQRVVSETKPLFTDHPIALHLAAPALVLADPIRVEQIVLNLLDNARKYSPAGQPIELTVTTDAQAHLSVRDYGPGIPEEDLPHLFDRFYRSSSVTRATIGLGLGLALSRELAQRMGGDITVTTAPGHGATFVLTLPLTVQAATTLITGPQSVPAAAPAHTD